MKKILVIGITLILLCFSVVSNAVVTNSAEYNSVKVYVFYKENSKAYKEEKDWLEEYTKNDIRVIVEEIEIKQNSELAKKVKDTLKIKKDKLPLTIIGSNYFIGFNKKVEKNLTEAIEAYKKADNYGDVLEKIMDNEDAKTAIEQNKGIYKQRSSFSVIWKIILITLLKSIHRVL